MSPVATLAAAKQFERSFDLCFGNGATASDGGQSAIVPAGVCLAFACELYLKSLLEFADQKTAGHNLMELFKSLPDADAYEVARLSGLDSDAFADRLQATSYAFVQWRYLHEAEGKHVLDLQLLQLLSGACRQVARLKETALRAKLGEA